MVAGMLLVSLITDQPRVVKLTVSIGQKLAVADQCMTRLKAMVEN